MSVGQLVFAQVMSHLPLKTFSRIVMTHKGARKVKSFTCMDQFLSLAFAQLSGRESLRDIELNLRIAQASLYRCGFRCKRISRNTLANANATRPWQMFAELAHHLIGTARSLYQDDALQGELSSLMSATVYALDSTTIDLCLSLFPWAPFRQAKAAIKLHTLMELRGSIPSFIHISSGKMHDVKMLDILANQGYIEPGAYYVMDKAYVDFARLYQLHTTGAFFVTRAKRNMQITLVQDHAVEFSTGLISDQTVQLTGYLSATRYLSPLRCITYQDLITGKVLVFMTNNMRLPALTICALYKQRWQVELFFRWIKQHLKIKAFIGNNENAVKTQVWVAISTYVLIAIAKKRLNLSYSMHEILRAIELNLFAEMPIINLLQGIPDMYQPQSKNQQLNLFSTLGQ